MKKRYVLFLLSAAWSAHTRTSPINAITIVPVADLVGDPRESKPNNLGLEPINHATTDCPRLHQLLFNEPVRIIEQRGNWVHVAVPTIFYQDNATKTRRNLFWARSAWFAPCDYHPSTRNTIALKQPLWDPVTKQTFSAGTRFIIHSVTKTGYQVYRYNLQQKRSCLLFVPKNHTLSSKSLHQQRAQFVELVRSWAHIPQGFIPYVWGGTSFCMPCTSTTITKNDIVYERPGHNPAVFDGFDCSGLVLRAAQTVGIKHPFKNTTTLAHNLPALKPGDQVRNGDLILFAGHVIIISDVQNNYCVEARGHEHGYGRVHEAPLGQLFLGIRTTADLVAAYHQQTPLLRRDSTGAVVQHIKQYKILRLIND